MPLPTEATDVTSQFLGLIDVGAPGLVRGLYLRGSLGLGEYFHGQSDVDFTAVLARPPDSQALDALASAHAAVFAAHPHPRFDGFHLVAEQLARPPDECPDLPCMFDGAFRVGGRFDVNPVSWHELARHAIVVRGPVPPPGAIWTDDAALRAYTHGNLTSYWAGVADALAAHPAEASTAAVAAWCVLGVSRLHYLLATGGMTSKSGAGRHALTAFGPQWHGIVHEALRAPAHPAAPSAYDVDPFVRGQDTTAFTVMAIDAALALGAAAATSSW